MPDCSYHLGYIIISYTHGMADMPMFVKTTEKDRGAFMLPFLIHTLGSLNLVSKVMVKLTKQPSPARVPALKSPIVC